MKGRSNGDSVDGKRNGTGKWRRGRRSGGMRDARWDKE